MAFSSRERAKHFCQRDVGKVQGWLDSILPFICFLLLAILSRKCVRAATQGLSKLVHGYNSVQNRNRTELCPDKLGGVFALEGQNSIEAPSRTLVFFCARPSIASPLLRPPFRKGSGAAPYTHLHVVLHRFCTLKGSWVHEARQPLLIFRSLGMFFSSHHWDEDRRTF